MRWREIRRVPSTDRYSKGRLTRFRSLPKKSRSGFTPAGFLHLEHIAHLKDGDPYRSPFFARSATEVREARDRDGNTPSQVCWQAAPSWRQLLMLRQLVGNGVPLRFGADEDVIARADSGVRIERAAGDVDAPDLR
jgi:hypothetical protein